MSAWPIVKRLGEIPRSGTSFAFEADAKARAEIVRDLDLASLDRFEGEIRVESWLDGFQIDGRYSAALAQICGITAEPLPVQLANTFSLRVLPAASANAPQAGEEVEIDPDAEDPPDLLEDDRIDLTAYAFEHLALDLDPFPRKPGAEFVPPEESADLSPFAVLKAFKPPEDGQ